MQVDFDERIDRTGTQSIKYDFDAMKRRAPALADGAIPMWIADMDFATPEPILAAMRERLDRRILGYTAFDDAAYLGCVASWMQRRFGWTVDPAQIAFSSGIVSALYAAVELITAPGDEVLILTPAYHPFEQAALDLGRKPLMSALVNNGGYYTIDFDDLEQKAARTNCRMLFWCSPHNPTGRVWSKEELRRVGEICFQNGVFLVSDEIHADVVRRDVQHTPLASLFPSQQALITCTSPSKTFNIAGNRHANIIIPDPALRARWQRCAYCGHPGPLSMAATVAAYDCCEGWLEAVKAYLDDSFAMMADRIRASLPKAAFRIPEGTYLGWVDLSGYGLPDAQLSERIQRAGVLVQFGEDFVADAEGFMRINIACPRSVFSEALKRIAAALR